MAVADDSNTETSAGGAFLHATCWAQIQSLNALASKPLTRGLLWDREGAL